MSCDLALPQLLFAYRAVPHPSLGFSPFELMYEREVRGLLEMVHHEWEGSRPSGETNVVDFVNQLQNTLQEAWALAKESLQDAQQDQKAWYDQHARTQTFK